MIELNLKIGEADFKIKSDKKINNTTLKKFKEYVQSDKFTIYFNDLGCYHWVFDFKINDIWFSSKKINNELTKFVFTASQGY
jgi:hypothetical protein